MNIMLHKLKALAHWMLYGFGAVWAFALWGIFAVSHLGAVGVIWQTYGILPGFIAFFLPILSQIFAALIMPTWINLWSIVLVALPIGWVAWLLIMAAASSLESESKDPAPTA